MQLLNIVFILMVDIENTHFFLMNEEKILVIWFLRIKFF